MITRVAYLSFHTSPLTRPGTGNAGGMNVYIDELARTMVQRGVQVDVFTRRCDPASPRVVDVSEGYRVIHIEAGPLLPLPVSQLTDHVFDFAEAVIDWTKANGLEYDLVHSHYWLSGWAGLMVKRVLGIPLANSFHTLGRVKDLTKRDDEPPSALLRIAAEIDVIGGSDCVIASTPVEFDDLLEHYGADPTRLCLNPPGVNHDLFKPGDMAESRRAVGVDPERDLVLFVGRIQALKGIDVALEAFAKVVEERDDVDLLVLGGPSGVGGKGEYQVARQRVIELGLDGRVGWRDPVAHNQLPAFYQSANLLLFPSRSESFGLVAVEAQACGVPVIAASIGGLTHAVAHQTTGILVDGWDPGDYAGALIDLLGDHDRWQSFSEAAVIHAKKFSWTITANRLLELYDGITS